ncbi:MAG: CBS domain-containing protein, partial [Anaerolineales bacterium]
NAGDYTVYPENSIETLMDLMTESGWGQIPVVDPSDEQIIGIVTRTDLLKTLRMRANFEERLNFSSRLEESLPTNILDLLKKIARQAQVQHTAIFIVGGFVRDLILGYENLDFDLVVEGDAISFTKSLSDKFGGRVTSHARFGTAKWHLFNYFSNNIEQQKPEKPNSESLSIDFVSARTEFYTYPTALPTVERGSIKLDLHRRDFTINTLALRMDGQHFGELYDYWGGLRDLTEGKIRVLHSLSFVDDPTRILRAVRFEQKFNFQIEPRTLELLAGAISLLDRLSGDRLRHELDDIFNEIYSYRIVSRLQNLNLLKNIDPSLDCNELRINTIKKIQDLKSDQIWEILEGSDLKRNLSYIALTIGLPEEDIKRIINRLRCPAELEKILLEANSLWRKSADFFCEKPSVVVEYLNNFQIISIFGFYLIVPDDAIKQTLLNFVEKWRFISTKVDGFELRQRGISPGPVYRQILGELKKARIDGDISSDEEETEFLEEIIGSLPDDLFVEAET